MSEEPLRDQLAAKTVVYRIPGDDAVSVRRDVAYRTTGSGELTMDLYYPPLTPSGARHPGVVIVAGYPDAGFEAKIGCKFKDLGSSVSWGRLLAASGLAAITYANRDPETDLRGLFQFLRQNAESLVLDENRIGVWASSGNVPLALSLLMQEAGEAVACAALCYGVMLDQEGSRLIAEMARQFGFSNPCAGKTAADLRPDVPIFLARAGQDQFPHLNESLDRFLAAATARNLPITFVNHPEAPHAFDLFYDSDFSREVIKRLLAFLHYHLRPGGLEGKDR